MLYILSLQLLAIKRGNARARQARVRVRVRVCENFPRHFSRFQFLHMQERLRDWIGDAVHFGYACALIIF
jgi:hypothetical protein